MVCRVEGERKKERDRVLWAGTGVTRLEAL